MLARLAGIALVLICAAAGWFILSVTLAVRTQDADQSQRTALSGLWGDEQLQPAPTFTLVAHGADQDGTRALRTPASSRIDVDLALDQRRKGLLWYSTYAVAFAGTYRSEPADTAGRMRVRFAFPSKTATFDDVIFTIDGVRVTAANDGGGLTASVPVARGRSVALTVGYRSHGLGTWRYRFGEGVIALRDFTLAMRTNFAAIDFPPQTAAPTAERRTPEGWLLQWHYSELIGASGIGMAFPQHLQPGPLAQRLTVWAPLSLVFYVFVMLVITTLRKIDLHPVNYFFLAAAFFAFHLLFAYTVDRLRIEYAFVLCSLVSMALTISYLRLVAGLRFAAVEAALAQFFYLILFSFALFDEGSSGLSITIGAIVTLFITMQLTARIDWNRAFRTAAPPAPAHPASVQQ